MTLVGLLITVLILCFLVWVVRMLLTAFAVGEPISTVVWVVVVALVIIYIVQKLGYSI